MNKQSLTNSCSNIHDYVSSRKCKTLHFQNAFQVILKLTLPTLVTA